MRAVASFVVAPRLGQVDLVTTLRAVLVDPQAAVGSRRGALGVAVAVAPDLGQCAGSAHEGIVAGHAAVLAHAHHLAQVVVQRLRVLHALEALAQGKKQRAVRPPVLHAFDDAAAKMQAAGHLGALAEDHAHVLQLRAVLGQARAGERGAVARGTGGSRLGEAEINRAVGRKTAVEHHIEQSALPACGQGRQPGHRWVQAAIGLDHPQTTGPLSHQEAALRQEGHRPRVLQPLRDRDGPHRARSRLRPHGRCSGLQQHSRYQWNS
jgi:hypothetical protein